MTSMRNIVRWGLLLTIGSGFGQLALVPATRSKALSVPLEAPLSRVRFEGGGGYRFPPDKVPTTVYDQLARRVTLGPTSTREEPTVRFSWPLRWAAGHVDHGFYATNNFVDHDPAFPNRLLDYNKLKRTYDLSSGYNHSGTDINLWPFAWDKMAQGAVEVVAAANGTILAKQDGQPDQNCSLTTDLGWNGVSIVHSDNSVSIYGHLKRGSLTAKGVGESVVAGEYLALVGSSGMSTSPHLHFEVRDAGNNLIDPYVGLGNPTVSQSLWRNQKPYYDSSINHLGVGSAAPESPAACAPGETIHEAVEFAPGKTLYFAAYYRDELADQVSTYTIYQPSGATFQTWTHSLTRESRHSASYWYWSYRFPREAALGTWRFEVAYEGATYRRSFVLTTTTSTPTRTAIATQTPTITVTPSPSATLSSTTAATETPEPSDTATAAVETPTAVITAVSGEATVFLPLLRRN